MPGFSGMHTDGRPLLSYTYRQPLILAFWPQPINLRGLFHINDSCCFTHLCFRYPYTHARRGSVLGSPLPSFHPALRIED